MILLDGPAAGMVSDFQRSKRRYLEVRKDEGESGWTEILIVQARRVQIFHRQNLAIRLQFFASERKSPARSANGNPEAIPH